MPDDYGLAAARFRDPRLRTGPFPQWPTLPPMQPPTPHYMEKGDRWRALDPMAPEPTPLGIAMALAGAKFGRKVTPAVKVEGKIFTGVHHGDAMDAARAKLGDAPVDRAFASILDEAPNMASHFDGFVTPDGRYLDRHQAAKYLGLDQSSGLGPLGLSEVADRFPQYYSKPTDKP